MKEDKIQTGKRAVIQMLGLTQVHLSTKYRLQAVMEICSRYAQAYTLSPQRKR
ncbi:hypothetical protein EZS27_015235 [termite gut metagenome]|uniref:Uncharacterized protein n=1 Tax=termite gut metagenome TaxID=433724 RepID=A0A5J4RTH0_9ZZZZ